MKILILCLITFASLSLSAEDLEMGQDRGGGFFVHYKGKLRLLDTVEAEKNGIEYIKGIEDLPGYQEVVIPTLLKLDKLSPEFATDLFLESKKTWIFVGTELTLPEDPQTDLSVLVCGDQDAYEIKIFKPCMSDKRSIQDRGAFLFHELLRGYTMRVRNQTYGRDVYAHVHKKITAYNLRQLTHRLIYNKYMTEKHLQQTLKKFGLYRVSLTSHVSYLPPKLPFDSSNYDDIAPPKDFIKISSLTGRYSGKTKIEKDTFKDCSINITFDLDQELLTTKLEGSIFINSSFSLSGRGYAKINKFTHSSNSNIYSITFNKYAIIFAKNPTGIKLLKVIYDFSNRYSSSCVVNE